LAVEGGADRLRWRRVTVASVVSARDWRGNGGWRQGCDGHELSSPLDGIPQGRLVTCEHRTRRVTRTELDGSITVIADKYNGKRLNSPNDVVVASNGSIWFTDPTYGIGGNYEGLKQAQEQDKHYVFRVDGKTGEIKPVVDYFTQPKPAKPEPKRII
jgi:SMP-30/Gluconolactonase/LRE-like region